MDLKAVQRCATEARIVCLNPFKLSDVLEDILSVGEAIGTQTYAQNMVAGLQARIDKAVATAKAHTNGHRPKVRTSLIVLSQNLGPKFPPCSEFYGRQWLRCITPRTALDHTSSTQHLHEMRCLL